MKPWIFRHIFIVLAMLFVAFSLSSCIREEEYSMTRQGTFETLWKILDEHYCFFDYKGKEYGLDWNEVHDRYAAQLNDTMSAEQVFDVLSAMTYELRDGHVNLYSAGNVARYGAWFDDYPVNFSDTIIRKILGRTDEYRQTGSLKYRIISDSIGYVRCNTFEGGLGDASLYGMTSYFKDCCALIIDVRNNGGGMLSAAETFTSMFVKETTTVGYMQHKTGKGHSDFSVAKAIKVEPHRSVFWGRPVIVLTNRRTYSAANSFVMYMRTLPQVLVVGDRTGGGSGMPFSSELPMGWKVRFSASPMLDTNGRHTEFGIDPDVKVDITSADFDRQVDTIVETALSLIRKFYAERTP